MSKTARRGINEESDSRRSRDHHCRGRRVQARAGRCVRLGSARHEAKKDKNFKAVNPYAPKKAKASKKKR